MARNIFGLDIGTSNIKIYSKDKDYILNEKNIIAIANKTEIFAFGDEAFEMHEKAPDNIKVSFPIKNGVIADFDNMQTLFIEFIKKMTKQSRRLPSADYYIAVPTGITEVEMPGTTIIGFDAFFGCALTKVTFPLCTQVGSSAFNWCGKLEKADFGSTDITTVKNLGQAAFQNTSALKALILRYSVVIPLENSNVFGTNSGITTGIGHVYVPSALIPEYQVATNWASIYAEYPEIFQPIEGSGY